MEMTITEPRFEEDDLVHTLLIPDFNLIFTTKQVGPASFSDLRRADYGKDFRMSTMPELPSLIYTAFKYREQKGEDEVTKSLIYVFKNEWFPGNTGIYYHPQGMFVKDNPEMENGKIIPLSSNTLESQLGKHEERGVVFSDDRSLRFTPYNYKTGSQTPGELEKNTGIITLVNGEENAHRLSMASEYYKCNPQFWSFTNFNKYNSEDNIRIACIGTDILEDWLNIGAVDSANLGNYWGSFGAKEMNLEKRR